MARKKSGALTVADQEARRVGDTLENMATGLGTMRDKSQHGRFVPKNPLTDQEIEACYEWDWVGRKVVDIPAFDMSREGIEWKTDKEAVKKLEAEYQRLQYDAKLFDALSYSRLYGGAVMVLGLPGDSTTEVKEIAAGALEYIHVLPKSEISGSTGTRIHDVRSPYYGEPQMYRINPQGGGQQIEIHPSRVAKFIGARAPSRRRQDWWGNSVLTAVYDAVQNAAASSQGVAALIHEAKTDVFKVRGLTMKLSDPKYAELLTKRYALADMIKSLINATIMDSEEEWEQKTINFSALPDVVRLYLQIAAGAADIPVTRLVGESPKGLNATGESDIRNYYDRISSEQEIFLRPQQSRALDFVILSALGARPDDLRYEFRPLWQLSEKERSENNERNAKAAKMYHDTRLVPTDALAKMVTDKMVEDGFYPGARDAIDEAEQEPAEFALGEEEAAKMAEEADREAQAEALKLKGGGGAVPGKKGAAPPAKRKAVKDAEPRSLYVSRKVKNPKAILAWAKAQGFETTEAGADLHVTIAYSRDPIDWMKLGDDFGGSTGGMTIAEGGPRIVERLGTEGAVVLFFASPVLSWRHENIKRAGASWDFPDYQPHITISYDPGDVDLKAIEPYRGKIELGPEIFDEVEGHDPERVG